VGVFASLTSAGQVGGQRPRRRLQENSLFSGGLRLVLLRSSADWRRTSCLTKSLLI
jgi:hypothetical protein